MNFGSIFALAALAICALFTGCDTSADTSPEISGAAKVRVFRGMCDASAAADLGGGRFVMADDETNTLRIYDLAPGEDLPVGTLDLEKFLMVPKVDGETDIEGCTQIGDTLYWITSHGRSKKGNWREARYRFFATKLVPESGGKTFSLKPEGKPTRALLTGLQDLKDPSLKPFIGKVGDKAKPLAPKDKGLNIESICASDDGKIIYIGFRNPRPGNKAILLPLHNPAELVADPATQPKFGAPIYFDFGGLGFRAMEYSPFHREFVIIAGSHEGKDSSALYRWKGDLKSPAKRIQAVPGFNPETVLVDPTSGMLRLFSDDGSLGVAVEEKECAKGYEDGKCDCKNLIDPNKRSFRMVELDLPGSVAKDKPK